MGLDTVELLMEIERFFKIQIRPEEAEQIGTIQDMTLCAAKHLNIVSDKARLQQEMFLQIQKVYSSLALHDRILRLDDAIAEILNPADIIRWEKLEEQLQLPLPKPIQEIPKLGFIRSINKWLTGNPSYQWAEINCGQFIDTFCAVSYERLINPQAVRDQYDIYVAVAGITIRVSGIDPYEVRPEKTFTDDLGMD